MKKHVKFKVHIYHADVWVVIDENEASRLAAVKCGVFTDDFSAYGSVFYGNDNNVVWLPADCHISTLVHESMHVVLNICHCRGIHVDTNNQEPVTYLIGYMVTEIMRAHDKLKDSTHDNA